MEDMCHIGGFTNKLYMYFNICMVSLREMSRATSIVMFVFALLVGASFGWWGHSVLPSSYTQTPKIEVSQTASSTEEGRFYAESFMPLSFIYPKRQNAIWLEGNSSSFSYSAEGIPTDAKGLIFSSKPTILPRLEVRTDGATTTDFALMSYIDAKYPSSAYGAEEYRTALTPFESSDHQFSGYFVKYEVDGMAGYLGEALVFKLNKGCNSPNPSDCAYFIFIVDNISGMYTPSEFQKIANSIVRVP